MRRWPTERGCAYRLLLAQIPSERYKVIKLEEAQNCLSSTQRFSTGGLMVIAGGIFDCHSGERPGYYRRDTHPAAGGTAPNGENLLCNSPASAKPPLARQR